MGMMYHTILPVQPVQQDVFMVFRCTLGIHHLCHQLTTVDQVLYLTSLDAKLFVTQVSVLVLRPGWLPDCVPSTGLLLFQICNKISPMLCSQRRKQLHMHVIYSMFACSAAGGILDAQHTLFPGSINRQNLTVVMSAKPKHIR